MLYEWKEPTGKLDGRMFSGSFDNREVGGSYIN